MKIFLNVLRLSFLIIGGVVGAGFLSGRELLSFFGRGNFILNSALSLIVLAVLFLAVGRLATNEKAQNTETVLFNQNKVNGCFLFVSLSICLVCMLSGLNALTETLFGVNTCLVGALSLIVCFFVSQGEIKRVERVNSALTLITLLSLVFCVFSSGKLNFESYGKINPITPIVFSFINFYLCVPIFFKACKNKKRVEVALSVIIACTTLFVLSILIFGRINACGESAKHLSLPIFATVSGKLFFVVGVVMATGILSSVTLSYYSAVKTFNEKNLVWKKIIFSVMLVLLSKIGLTTVVDYMYPLIGGFGALFAVSVFKIYLGRYKKRKTENNNIKS